jgi:hypothetical protein
MRDLKTRLKEHKSALFNHNLNSNIAEHGINCRHDIDWDDPEIKYFEKITQKRKFLESFQIEKMKFAKLI